MKLAETNLLKLLPEHISKDAQFYHSGIAANTILQTLSRSIPNLLIYARLGSQDIAEFLPPLRRLTESRPGLLPLSTQELEALAWQFHVDFRETAKTDAELARMVLSAIPWHRIKGTPAGIYRALALFGYNGCRIEEDGEGDYWAAWQLGLPEITALSDLKQIQAVCQEMQPARCRLWRVYNDAWDQRPGVFDSYGRYSWDNCWWDLYSGVEFPDIPGDNGGLIVSFGKKIAALCNRWQTNSQIAAFGQHQLIAILIPYQDHYIWDVSEFDTVLVRNHGFVVGEVVSTQIGELQFHSTTWETGKREWDNRPWGEGLHYDRVLPLWEICVESQPKSQFVFDDGSDKLTDWSGFDDLNSCNDVPMAALVESPPAWDNCKWDNDSRCVKIFPVLDETLGNLALPAPPLDPQIGTGAMQDAELIVMSGNEPLAISPEISAQSVFAGASGKIAWQSDVWIEEEWPDREWARAAGLMPALNPCSFVIKSTAKQTGGNI